MLGKNTDDILKLHKCPLACEHLYVSQFNFNCLTEECKLFSTSYYTFSKSRQHELSKLSGHTVFLPSELKFSTEFSTERTGCFPVTRALWAVIAAFAESAWKLPELCQNFCYWSWEGGNLCKLCALSALSVGRTSHLPQSSVAWDGSVLLQRWKHSYWGISTESTELPSLCFKGISWRKAIHIRPPFLPQRRASSDLVSVYSHV